QVRPKVDENTALAARPPRPDENDPGLRRCKGPYIRCKGPQLLWREPVVARAAEDRTDLGQGHPRFNPLDIFPPDTRPRRIRAAPVGDPDPEAEYDNRSRRQRPNPHGTTSHGSSAPLRMTVRGSTAAPASAGLCDFRLGRLHEVSPRRAQQLLVLGVPHVGV